jgi:hypothetical protein
VRRAARGGSADGRGATGRYPPASAALPDAADKAVVAALPRQAVGTGLAIRRRRPRPPPRGWPALCVRVANHTGLPRIALDRIRLLFAHH